MSDNNPMPAFPQPFIQNERGIDFPFDGYGRGGISERDYFAAKMMPQICMGNMPYADAAKLAYAAADAMLKERTK